MRQWVSAIRRCCSTTVPARVAWATSSAGPARTFRSSLLVDQTIRSINGSRRRSAFRTTSPGFRDKHTFRFGGDFKRHQYDSSLPEEQATEFEKFDSITQFLTGNATEADTQFGHHREELPLPRLQRVYRRRLEGFSKADAESRLAIRVVHVAHRKTGPHRQLRFRQLSSRVSRRQVARLALCDSPSPGFLVPANVQNTGLGNVDGAIAATARAGNNHTLRGQD